MPEEKILLALTIVGLLILSHIFFTFGLLTTQSLPPVHRGQGQ